MPVLGSMMNYLVNLSLEEEQDTVFRWSGTTWYGYDEVAEPTIRSLESTDDKLLVVANTATFEINTDLDRKEVAFDCNFGTFARPAHAIIDDDNLMWIADRVNGLVRHEPVYFGFSIVRVNGPSFIR